jgi:hypothetical protein
MAVTESLSPTEQPKAEETSPMTAVRTPINIMDTTKHSHPFIRSTGDDVQILFQGGREVEEMGREQTHTPRKKFLEKKRERE